MTTRILEKFANWKKAYAVRKELNSLDDRQLDDLGIGRWQIPLIARMSVAH